MSGGRIIRRRIVDARLNKPIEVEPGAYIPRDPSLVDMLENFEAASVRLVQRWAKFGVRKTVVSKQRFLDRLVRGCRQCPFGLWQEDARLGLGKCNHKDCGCTKLKLWVASEKCPAGVWKEQQLDG